LILARHVSDLREYSGRFSSLLIVPLMTHRPIDDSRLSRIMQLRGRIDQIRALIAAHALEPHRDVLVCTFASADEAKAAQDAGLQWVGDTTGASQAKGTFLIAAADRRKADPNGKTINQLIQTFRKL